MDGYEARIRQRTRRYQETGAAHEAAREALVNDVVAALKAGERPTDVTEWSPFTATYVRDLARTHDVPDYMLRRYRSARGWLDDYFPDWPAAAAALAGLEAGLEDAEFTGGVLWYGLTHARTRAAQKRAITSRLARWATRPGAGQRAAGYATAAELEEAIGQILDQHLPRR